MNVTLFKDVRDTMSLAAVLASFTEDDLIKYDRETRAEIINELQQLCLRFSVVMPLYLRHAGGRDDIYDKQARMRGVTPRSMLDYVNEDFDASFSSMDEFKQWLAAQAVEPHVVNNDADAEEA